MKNLDLAAENVGGWVLAASDEYFGPAESLLKEGPPIWKEDAYLPSGKWMDGWETRRRRESGHDWCVLRLGVPGILDEVVVDTSYFHGNFPPECSIEACVAAHNTPVSQLRDWQELVPRSHLQGHYANSFSIKSNRRWTHLRLNLFPDGGVARLRALGRPLPDWMASTPFLMPVDLAAQLNGGSVVSCSDMSFGHRQNLNLPGPARQMKEGWETRRRRRSGHEWAIVKLAASGQVLMAELDTSHFKGNAPEAACLEGSSSVLLEEAEWFPLLPRQGLLGHTVHRFSQELQPHSGVRWVRLNLYPDGGMARLRLWGLPDYSGREQVRLQWLNSLSSRAFEKEMQAVCTSTAWTRGLERRRPFLSLSALVEAGQKIWEALTESDWLEAFAGHPRIGARKVAGQGQTSQAWSAQEQAAVSGHQEELAEGNRQYEEKFGFVFLICATGKSAEAILKELQRRLPRERAQEILEAAGEQAKINALRLEKYLQR